MKAVPVARAELFAHQLPDLHRAIKEGKPFGEAVSIAQRETGATVANPERVNVRFYGCVPPDAEAERANRAQREADERNATLAEKRKRTRRKAPYDPAKDALAVTVCLIDDDGNVIARAPEWQGTGYDIADRLFSRTDVMTSTGERFETPDFRLVIDEITRVGIDGRPIAFQDTRNSASPEVWQAIRLPIEQRKLFGAAKDRGLSDADALATALGDEHKATVRDEYQSRLTSAWKSSNP